MISFLQLLENAEKKEQTVDSRCFLRNLRTRFNKEGNSFKISEKQLSWLKSIQCGVEEEIMPMSEYNLSEDLCDFH